MSAGPGAVGGGGGGGAAGGSHFQSDRSVGYSWVGNKIKYMFLLLAQYTELFKAL